MALPQAAHRIFLSLIISSILILGLVTYAQAQHSVELKWQDPHNPPDTVDYKIWRKQEGGIWAVIGTAHYPTLSFRDKTVVSGDTYKYEVRARRLNPCSANCASAFSKQVTVTIP